MSYLDLDIPEKKGIYLFLLPTLKVGYVGSSNNLKRRYLEHIKSNRGGNKVIRNQVEKQNKVEYMILEYCDGYSNKDLKIIESNWIKHFKQKGLDLVNVSEPTLEPIYREAKPLIVYSAKTLEFVGEYKSSVEASKILGVHHPDIFASIKERKIYAPKGLFFFFQSDFSETMLHDKKDRYSKKKKKKSSKTEINQFSLNGQFIKTWKGIRETARAFNLDHMGIYNCCAKKQKTCGGYIWKYAEESELENENLRIPNLQLSK